MLASLLLALLAMMSLGLMIGGLAGVSQPDVVKGRLARYALPAHSLEEFELRQPFSERIIKPIVNQIARIIISKTPPKTVESIKRNLILAGNPNNLDVRDFLGIKGFLGLSLGAVMFLLFVKSGQLLQTVGISAVMAGLGYYLPNIWLSSKIKSRKKEIIKALPDALDLLTVCVGAGQGFDAALAKVVQKWDNALSVEFSRVLSEIRMGVSRREALRTLVARTDVPDVATFIGAIIQADQLGVSIGNVLQVQCEQMRQRRRQRAEELAHQAPIKMIFPMVLFIFPSIYVVVLGPAIPMIVKGLIRH